MEARREWESKLLAKGPVIFQGQGALTGCQRRVWVLSTIGRGRGAKGACSYPSLSAEAPPVRPVHFCAWHRADYLIFLLMVLEFKLTLLLQQSLCYKNPFAIIGSQPPTRKQWFRTISWELFFPHVLIILHPGPFIQGPASDWLCTLWGQAQGKETNQAAEIQFIELTINYPMKRTLM